MVRVLIGWVRYQYPVEIFLDIEHYYYQPGTMPHVPPPGSLLISTDHGQREGLVGLCPHGSTKPPPPSPPSPPPPSLPTPSPPPPPPPPPAPPCGGDGGAGGGDGGGGGGIGGVDGGGGDGGDGGGGFVDPWGYKPAKPKDGRWCNADGNTAMPNFHFRQ